MATTAHRLQVSVFMLLLCMVAAAASCTRDLPREEIFSDRQDAAPKGDTDAPGDAPTDPPEVVDALESDAQQSPDAVADADADSSDSNGLPDVPTVSDGAGEVSAADTAAGDGAASDAGAPDAGVNDAGQPDAGAPDAGQPDSGPTPTCKANETVCNGACVNTKVDDAHCGDCNKPCAGKCANGVCK